MWNLFGNLNYEERSAYKDEKHSVRIRGELTTRWTPKGKNPWRPLYNVRGPVLCFEHHMPDDKHCIWIAYFYQFVIKVRVTLSDKTL